MTFTTGDGKGFFSIVDNQFFTESIDKVFCSTGDFNSVRIYRCKFHCITNQIAPQSGIGGNDEGIIVV